MLSAATRPASRRVAVACTACSCSRNSSYTTSHSPRSSLSSRSNGAKVPRRPTASQKRHQATFAQAHDTVQRQEHHPSEPELDSHAASAADSPEQQSHPDEKRSADEGNKSAVAMAELLDALAEEVAGSSAAGPSSSSFAAPTAFNSAAATSSTTAPPTPTPRKPAAITLEDILNPKQNSAPEVADLRAFRPRRFTVPEASSPDSHRLVYRKTWDRAYAAVDRAFKKRQLQDFAGEEGLNVDLTDARLRTRIPGKKPKHWKSKRLDQMSKRELIHTILVLDFDMTHPDTIPTPSKGAQILDSIPLNDRTLFLLLSPKSPTIPKLVRHLGVTVAYRRNPESGIVSLILRGNSAGVQAAKAEIEALDETCLTTEFNLPAPASTLRPEVYQAISRQSKAFLEPGSEPTKLRSSAVQPKGLERTERHLNAAFAADATRKSTALFASIPSNLDTLRYALFPHEPLQPTSAILTGGTSQFARLKSLSIAPSASAVDDPAHRAQVELLEWTERMRIERTTRTALYVPAGMSPSLKESSILRALRAPFEAVSEHDGANLLEAKQVDIVARFGHVAWPLYRTTLPSSAGVAEGTGSAGLGPSFAGQRSFERVADWISSATEKVKSIFLPSPPNGLLAATDVLKPLPNPTATPFSSLFAPMSGTPEAVSAEQARLEDVAAGPTIESSVFRRWTYRPTKLPGREDPQIAERVEVVFEMPDTGGIPQVREMDVQRSEVRSIKENKVDVMVPTGSHDAQFTMSVTSTLDPEEYPLEFDIKTLTFHAPVPDRIRLSGRDYLLDTDHFVRRTTISPPPAAKSAPATSGAPAPLVQERWHSLTRDGTRGVDVFQPVGTGLVDEIRRAGIWRTALEEVERRCAATASGLAVAGGRTGTAGPDGKTPLSSTEGPLGTAGAAPGTEGSRLFARISRAPSSS